MPTNAEIPRYKIGSSKRKTIRRLEMIGVVRICTLSSRGPDTVALFGAEEEGREGLSEGSEGGRGVSS